MRFGIFDHLDLNPSIELTEQYEQRLRLVEAYDRAGFYCYHLAEHHSTPLGMAPSPAVFLSAVAQRTNEMRLGPLVYILTLQNPIRAYEDICMLDQLSRGRIELGYGRGVSPIELEYLGVPPAEARAIFAEATEVFMLAFAHTEISYDGKYFRFRDTPLAIKPFQKPHPRLWLGIGAADAIPNAVNRKMVMVCNGSPSQVAPLTKLYKETWQEMWNEEAPIVGVNRHIVVAEREDEAVRLAKFAYVAWYDNYASLWRKHGTEPRLSALTGDFDLAVRNGFVLAGTPDQVGEKIVQQVRASGINYLMCRLAFGDLPFEASLRSTELMSQKLIRQIASAV